MKFEYRIPYVRDEFTNKDLHNFGVIKSRIVVIQLKITVITLK